MVMMISSFSPKNLYKRINIYNTLIVITLCSIAYLLGSYQRPAVSPAADDSFLRKSPCSTTTATTTSLSASGFLPLDFASHHRAEDLTIINTTTSSTDDASSNPIHQFPACDVKLFEYTPCEDGKRSLRFPRERLIYRERHCPEKKDEKLRCLIPAPHGYRRPVQWPESRDTVWFSNVPHKWLTVEKAGQNWVRFEEAAGGEGRFRFPGGGTMFPNGADAYIDEIEGLIGGEFSGGGVRTVVDTGCGVASLGAYLLSHDILTMSFAPKDTHEAQVQFALERGVPAMIGILASNRLPYPSRAFDMAHCSRCLIPWGQYDGLYLIEVDRILRPGGYWVLSGPPINWQKHWKGWARTQEDLDSEQSTIESVAKKLCWKKLKQKGDLSIWQKPSNHVHCKKIQRVFKKLNFCWAQKPDQAWYTKMEVCLTPLPEVSDIKETAGGQLARWPERLTTIPPRISRGSVEGVTPDVFNQNTETWKMRISYYKSLNNELAESGRYRNFLDMNAYLGGFAAALIDEPVWVMNVVPVEAKVNTLGVIYERGLIGIYHNWCEAMSTYPRTYDFIHADQVFSLYQGRCDMEDILLEMDRLLRPEGSVIFVDDVDVMVKAKSVIDGMKWESRMHDHEKGPHYREKVLVAVKQYWTAPAPAQTS
ncbi:putative methyltransferase PMT15 [Drosera capensis]